LSLRIVRRQIHEHADASDALGLLRARRKRPRRCGAEQRDELASFHSITSSVDHENLIDRPPRKAISPVPKLAKRTPFAFVVNSFLVRTADYAVGHRD
jgi:hypothetical protein